MKYAFILMFTLLPGVKPWQVPPLSRWRITITSAGEHILITCGELSP